MAKKGYHPIQRSILDHHIWQDKPFARGQAWIDLILLANHKDRKAVIQGKVVIVKKGQVYRSQLTLGQRWGWSRPRTKRFINFLKSDHMVDYQALQHGTLITILNYNKLHDSAFHGVTPNVTPNVTSGVTPGVTPNVTHTINVNTLKECRIKHGNNVLLSPSDYEGLVRGYGKSAVEDYIERVDDYCASSGKAYKDYAAAIRNFMKRDGVQKKKKIRTLADD